MALLLLACGWARMASAGDEFAADPNAVAGDEDHARLLAENPFPSATECGACHQRQYREWSVSPHAYAQISPTYNAYQGLLVHLTKGTLGDFCVRCHTQVGMTQGEPVITSNENRGDVSVEGITCVVCHRVPLDYGKHVGRFPLVSGDVTAPIWGPHDDTELQRVLEATDTYKRLVTEPGSTGRKLHADANRLAQMSSAGFCGRCHDVRLVDGFRLEDAFSEYKQSPAAARGETCQDCHMGPVPGIASEYPPAPAAVIGGVPTSPTRRTNHMFPGPDVPVVHPGLFPHNPDATAFATPDEWLQFDWAAGWGTDEFEDTEPDDVAFPERWASIDDRYDARAIVEAQLALRTEARERGTTLLRNGYALEPIVERPAEDGGLAFEVSVRNGTDGHSAPTGLIAERMVFLQVDVLDAAGAVVFRSGDLDPDGDVRDRHSEWVRQGLLPLDEQLFNLRSPFLVRALRGSEREQILPANYSFDPLIFVRPSPTPSLLLGGVPAIRLHKRSIEPGGMRGARYAVAAEALTGAAPYTARVRLVAGPLPVHLIRALAPIGFEWGLSPRDVTEALLTGYRIVWERELCLEGR